MKQITISIILLLLIGGTAFAQETTTQDSLIGKWRFIYPPHNEKGMEYIYTYTDKEEILTFYFEGDSVSVYSNYYLSNNIPEQFDFEQIGKNKNGKYIIALSKVEKADEFSSTNIFEIVELSATTEGLYQKPSHYHLKTSKYEEIFNICSIPR